jgi:parvulin-like peptidyl-prolyl isomerase
MLLTVGCEPKRKTEVARVDGVAILAVDVEMELRGVLWKRGESWDGLDQATRQTRRQEALDRCVEEMLLMGFAKTREALPPAQAQVAEAEYQQFLKQFEPPEGWKTRLELQEVSEAEMRERIAREVSQGEAIEGWLKAQRALEPLKMEEAARKWFEEHREEWNVPERARVSHFFLTGHEPSKPDRSAEIAEFHRRLTAGETTLAALASQSSEDSRSKKAGGSLGWIERDRVPGDFAEKIFAMELKKVSAPFQTKLGWHIAVVHEKKPGRWAEFTEVKEEVMARLDQAWRETQVKKLVQELRAKAKIETDEEVLVGVEPVP